ncbi:hypothetical protein [Rhodococcus tukisamuensis]|uniref:hypothetical protein n=1 Tax=Rhodococcus tukisamuensis TaxID=168276 RepID=UPI001475B741|nr:hypothetical protein [Rhodococcus tukisamuensis]
MSARRGVRRYQSEIAKLLANPLDRKTTLESLSNPAVRRSAISGCLAATWNGHRVVIKRPSFLARVPLDQLLPVRRLGSNPDARSNLCIHTTRRGSVPHVVWAESKLEALWMVELDRLHGDYESQACALVWPVGERMVIQFPDLVVRSGSTTAIWSVRSARRRSEYASFMLSVLIPETAAAHGLSYHLAGDISLQRAANLRVMDALRWKSSVTSQSGWANVVATRPTTLGAVVEAAGGGAYGRAIALRGLAQVHYDTDLERPFGRTSAVVWR